MNQSIICPAGLGETDRNQCLDRISCLLPYLVCLHCPVPVALIAGNSRDNFNRHIAARLRARISCPWTPPEKAALAAIECARQAATKVGLPCSTYQFYKVMQRIGAPALSPGRRVNIIRKAGFVVARDGGGIERVMRVRNGEVAA